MAWPPTCTDLAIIDALRDALAASSAWLDLDPLDGAVVSVDWPVTTIDGPRALVHVPKATNDAGSQTTRGLTYEVTIEIHVPVEGREALAAFASLRDAVAALEIPRTRIMSASIGSFERGKYVSSTAASTSTSSTSTTVSTPDEPSPAWSRASSVAHKCEITVRLFQAHFTTP